MSDGSNRSAEDPVLEESNEDEEASYASYCQRLAEGLKAALPTWVVRCVHQRYREWAGATTPEVELAAEVAGQLAGQEVGRQIVRLLEADLEAQHTTPLALVRSAVAYPTEVLAQAGVPAVRRDRYLVERFPEDLYDLTPANVADLDPSLAELALMWGAAKAFEHRRRHLSSAEGRRNGPGGPQPQG